MTAKELPEPIVRRLQACLNQLLAAHSGGSSMSSASKGMERELFVEVFLKNVMPPAYRFGSGDVVGADGSTSGQIDIIIENLTIPSFPLVGTAHPRLYLAEGVGAAIEVKSDLEKAWDDAVATAKKLSLVQRKQPIHLIVVGYRGWARRETALAKLNEAQYFGGYLTLDPPRYIGRTIGSREGEPIRGPDDLVIMTTREPCPYIYCLEGPTALWGFVLQLNSEVTSILWAEGLRGYMRLEPLPGQRVDPEP